MDTTQIQIHIQEKLRTSGFALFSFVVFLFIVSLLGTSSATESPTSLVEKTVQNVMEILKDDNMKKTEYLQKRRSAIRNVIGKRFDYNQMSKLTLGRHWKTLTVEQQKRFISLFSQTLEASYIDKIEAYTNETVNYVKETLKGGGKFAVVSTTVQTEKITIPIDYKLYDNKGSWFVYDVIVEGVSFITTYRGQYETVMTNESFDGLIEKMKNKLDE